MMPKMGENAAEKLAILAMKNRLIDRYRVCDDVIEIYCDDELIRLSRSESSLFLTGMLTAGERRDNPLRFEQVRASEFQQPDVEGWFEGGRTHGAERGPRQGARARMAGERIQRDSGSNHPEAYRLADVRGGVWLL